MVFTHAILPQINLYIVNGRLKKFLEQIHINALNATTTTQTHLQIFFDNVVDILVNGTLKILSEKV